MKYRIALQKTAEGYSVSAPGLPGCWSQGAIREYLIAREDLLVGAVVREVEVA